MNLLTLGGGLFLCPALVAKLVAAPGILTQPLGQKGLAGTDVSFTVAATGGASRNYQWSKNGAPLPGERSAVLRLGKVRATDAALYAVTVSDVTGATVSAAAALTVVPPAAATPPALPVVPPVVFIVTSYGALGDAATDNTLAVQSALDAAATRGGVVRFPASPRPYLCGPITLGSNTELTIDAGATLQMLPFGTYPPGDKAYANFIGCAKAHDVIISGQGTIDGQGARWWTAYTANRELPHRPHLINFTGCRNVLVTGVTLKNSPCFHLAANADHLTIFGVTILVENPNGNALNTDGIDPSGEHQLIQGCVVNVFDDNIAVKAGKTHCADITIADCAFGTGHGLSIGGQSNAGLDGMTVARCAFHDTTSGLRMKADPTQGGVVRNVDYHDLTMDGVTYPIVFYSYYHEIGNPGGTAPGVVEKYNAAPPDPLDAGTLPVWRHITVSNLRSVNTKGASIIWGLPLAGAFIDGVTLRDVRIAGGRGMKLYNAVNVRLTGDTDVGEWVASNALAVTSQPRGQRAAPGSDVVFSGGVTGTGGAAHAAPTFQWSRDGVALRDGVLADGASVAGATTASLRLRQVKAGEAGSYTLASSVGLDAYDPAARRLTPNSAPVVVTSDPAVLVVGN